MITRLRAAFARWVDCWRAEREESWGHPPDHRRDDESMLRWLRATNRKLGARHWRKTAR